MTSSISLIRIHISPLTPELLPALLGPLSLKVAQNISYHQVQTSPENNYGYVELPTMDAERVKKKFSGAILKGRKIKIDDAKPRKRKHMDVDRAANTESAAVETKPSSSKRKELDVISGRDISPDRKVQRGWTEARKTRADKKASGKSDKQKSKYSEKEELLFRTHVPPNKSSKTLDKKAKKKRGDAEVVHEFEKSTTQPSFLRESKSQADGNLHYVDGEGWTNETGEIVEPEPLNLKARRASRPNTRQSAPSLQVPVSDDAKAKHHQSMFESGTASESDDQDAESTESSSAPVTPHSTANVEAAHDDQVDVHPLEALFKKPKKPASSQDTVKPSLELTTSNFSFFQGTPEDEDDDGDEETEAELGVPLTPFSSQDRRQRGLRSAAPTPDTAHPSRFNSYGSSGLPGDEDEDESDDEDGKKAGSAARPSSQAAGNEEPSEFEKMFWEKRGDNNRAWKARRRAVLKEKRQRENRRGRTKNW